MAKKKTFDPVEARYIANWLRKCVAMERAADIMDAADEKSGRPA